MGPGLALLGLAFVSPLLLSWSLQTAVAAALRKPGSPRDRLLGKPRGPKNFDPMAIRDLLATFFLSIGSWGLLTAWLWTGGAKNLLRLV